MKTIEYTVKSKTDVTGIENFQLSKLHFRDGDMWPAYKEISRGDVILAKQNQKITGWAFLFYNKPKYSTDNSDNHIYIYVQKKFRRQGIGKNLLQLARRKGKKFMVHIHDSISKKFYKSQCSTQYIKNYSIYY